LTPIKFDKNKEWTYTGGSKDVIL